MDEATRRLTRLLAPLTNYERTRPDRPRWSLDTMRALLEATDPPVPDARLVQVGGSKGKGTTCLWLESLARAAGLRVGTYLSPHLHSILERVRIGGREVDEDSLRRALLPVLDFAAARELPVTFFEAMTRAALGCFATAGVDLGVLEVGLGGRLDATTAVPVDAAVVTGVELEHTELLGDTVEAIAAEKAAILRPGRPAFTAATGAALDVLRAAAERCGARLAVLGEDFGPLGVETTGDGFAGRLRTPAGRVRSFRMVGGAAFELPAMALGVACLEALWPDVDPPLDPAPRPALAGRCEVLDRPGGGSIVLDGAHTEGSMTALAKELERRFPGQRVAVLFASAAGKRWRESLKCLLPTADRVVVTTLTGTTCTPAGEIVDWLCRQGVMAEQAADPAEGVRCLARHPGVVVVTGSFYLVGAVRPLLQSTQA